MSSIVSGPRPQDLSSYRVIRGTTIIPFRPNEKWRDYTLMPAYTPKFPTNDRADRFAATASCYFRLTWGC